jgi:hypothetical protein
LRNNFADSVVVGLTAARIVVAAADDGIRLRPVDGQIARGDGRDAYLTSELADVGSQDDRVAAPEAEAACVVTIHQHGVAVGQQYGSLEDMLAGAKLDLLMVGSPNHLHLDHIRTKLGLRSRVEVAMWTVASRCGVEIS